MIVIVGKVQVKKNTFSLNFCISLLDKPFPLNLKRYAKALSLCHLIQFTAVALMQRTFGWASMIPLSHWSFLQCEQIKFRSMKSFR